MTFQEGGEEGRNVYSGIKTNQDYFDIQNIDIIVIVISLYVNTQPILVMFFQTRSDFQCASFEEINRKVVCSLSYTLP